MDRHKKLLRLISSLLLVLVGLFELGGQARPAAADTPIITSATIVQSTPVPFGTTCDGFIVLATFTVNRRNITWYDTSGNPVRQIRQVNFAGTLYNSVTGNSVPYNGTFDRRQDFVQNTVTFSGLHLRVQIPGQGVEALDVGRTVLDFSEDPPAFIFVAGQHDFDAQVCALLQ